MEYVNSLAYISSSKSKARINTIVGHFRMI